MDDFEKLQNELDAAKQSGNAQRVKEILKLLEAYRKQRAKGFVRSDKFTRPDTAQYEQYRGRGIC